MDGGLFSGQRSTDRRAAAPNRTEAATHKVVEEPRPAAEHHRQAAPAHHYPVRKSRKRIIIPFIIVAAIVLAGLGAWFLVNKFGNAGATGIDSSKYQAVFFTNGQVYFGKLKGLDDKYLKLEGIFYLQTKTTKEGGSEDPQQSTTDSSDVQLIKLGSEIHGPEDEMVISRDQVLFYENLKSDGKVAKSIDDYNKQ